MIVYRVTKRRRGIGDTTGAMLRGGRWSSPGTAVLYAAEHYATAIMEILVHHGRLGLPGPHHAALIDIPDDVASERFEPARARDWDGEGSPVARAFGDAWLARGDALVLFVPSVPGQPLEWNVLLNSGHPDFRRVRIAPPCDVIWDGRLFGPAAGSVS
jgi:RES domain-containing protein